jgi:hypothetical protein
MIGPKGIPFSITYKIKDQTVGMVPIPTDRKYPQSKKEFKTAMIASARKIQEELRYMAGCIYFTKAPELKPKTKSWWYEQLTLILGPQMGMYTALGIHPDQEEEDER